MKRDPPSHWLPGPPRLPQLPSPSASQQPARSGRSRAPPPLASHLPIPTPGCLTLCSFHPPPPPTALQVKAGLFPAKCGRSPVPRCPLSWTCRPRKMQGVQFPAPLLPLLAQKHLSNRGSTQPLSLTQGDGRARTALLNQPASGAGQEEGSSGKKIWGSSEKPIP